MLMKSEVEMRGKNWEEAKQTLEHTMKLPIVLDPQSINETQKAKHNRFSLPFGQEERARIFLNLVSVLCELGIFD